MQNLLDNVDNEKVVFVQNFRDLQKIKNLEDKKLCIIKTDFKDLQKIKKFMGKFTNVKVWLTSSDISRKHILNANINGFDTVIQYPVDLQLVRNYFSGVKTTASFNSLTNKYDFSSAKIMIVDDNPMNIELLVETLQVASFNLSTFLKPLDAIQKIEHEKFDLFLLDIMMPEISGFELADMIKKSKLNSNSPIIFISALSDSESKIKGYDMGTYAYIEKPFDVNVVRSQVINVLKTKFLQNALLDKKEAFFAMVTHDLKSPVNAEITALQLLLDNYSNELNSYQNEILNDILEATKYMKSLVDNILNKYKSDNNKLKINLQKCSLNKIISECIEETKYLYIDKNQIIKYSCPEQNTDIFVDYIEIKRVIHNILSNAYEYAPKNSQIEIDLTSKDEKLIFSVKNTGCSINLKNPNDIFDKFVSLAKQQKKIGTGLGLYVSKKIIEAHGGKIYADCKLNDFTKISFELAKSNS